jgi:hypothetical protein
MTRLIVTGGRGFAAPAVVWSALYEHLERCGRTVRQGGGAPLTVVHGMADPRHRDGHIVPWAKALEVPEHVSLVIRGTAEAARLHGADWAAGRWVRYTTNVLNRPGITAEEHPADWRLGRKAGSIRNKEMVRRGAVACYAFLTAGEPNYGSVGCAEMAWAAKILVRFWCDRCYLGGAPSPCWDHSADSVLQRWERLVAGGAA